MIEEKYRGDELSMKDLVLGIRDFLFYLIERWYLFATAIIVVIIIVWWSHQNTIPQYHASLTFALESPSSSSGNKTAILGQLGLGQGGESNPAAKIMELAVSKRVIIEVLLDSATVDGRRDVIGNHIISLYGLSEQWTENSRLTGFQFTGEELTSDQDVLTRNIAIKFLHRLIVGSPKEEPLFIISSDEKTGIFKILTSTINPELSIALSTRLYFSLEEYYVGISLKRQKGTLNQLNIRADSVESLLRTTESRLATELDKNSRILNRSSLYQQKLSREVILLNSMFSEIIRHRETASFVLASDRPAFIIIDDPVLPLVPSKGNVKLNIILWISFIVVVLVVMLFLVRVVKEALRET